MNYIIFDLDDTLLNDKREISPYTLDVLEKVQGLGHKIVYNTARSLGHSWQFFDQLRPDYAIVNGGSQIVDRNETVVFSAEGAAGTAAGTAAVLSTGAVFSSKLFKRSI